MPPKPKSKRPRTPEMPSGPLEAFFCKFSWFGYDPHQSASEQFHRLRTEAGWRRGDPEGKAAWEDYLRALVRQFNASFGTDDEDLTAWHGLLARIGITDFPDSVSECKQIIKGKFINLVDLVDSRNDPTRQIRHFPSEQALSKYTLDEHKVFPRDDVEAGNILRYLLRHIVSPNSSRRDPTISRGARRRRGRQRV